MCLRMYLKIRLQRESAIFFRQFATFIAAGIPIINACDMLLAAKHKPPTQSLLQHIKRDLLAGKPLSASLQRYPNFTDHLLSQLIYISECTGKLDNMLLTIADHLEKAVAFREQVRRALFYPSIVAITGLIITLIMLIFIVPRFEILFQDLHGTLPFITRVLFALSACLRQSYWFAIPLIAAATYITRHKKWHLLQQLPMIKSHLSEARLARFTRNLAITLQAGIPISNALTIASHSNNNPPFTHNVRQLSRRVRSGTSLHHALQVSPIFPPLLIQLCKTGEDTGQLDLMLFKAAEIMEADIERRLHRFGQLLEPLIMVILGVLIGGLVAGMYLPIFKLGSII